MRNLAKKLAVVALCLAAAGGAGAQNGPGPAPSGPGVPQPFITVSLPQGPLHFGMVSALGPKRLRASTTAHVVANRPFQLAASFQELSRGRTVIPGQQTTVVINGRMLTVGTARVEIASGGPTPANGVDVPIVIEIVVKGPTFYPAGRYSGNLELFVR